MIQSCKGREFKDEMKTTKKTGEHQVPREPLMGLLCVEVLLQSSALYCVSTAEAQKGDK